MPTSTPLPQLVCLAPSQSTEALLWVIEECSFPISIYRHVPIVHLLITQLLAGTNDIPILVAGETKTIGTLPVLKYFSQQKASQHLFIGEKIRDPEFDSLLQKFAVTLSYYVGQWAYAYLLPEENLCLPMLTAGTPFWERIGAWLGYSWISKTISDGFEIKPGGQGYSLEQIKTIGQSAMQLLADGRPYLAGNALTALDIAFATSLAPALLPPHYNGIKQPLEVLPPAMVTDIKVLRNTTFGAYVEKIYQLKKTDSPPE